MVRTFVRLRLRYYVGPLAVAVAQHTWMPAAAVVAGMAGTELMTLWHRQIEARGVRIHADVIAVRADGNVFATQLRIAAVNDRDDVS